MDSKGDFDIVKCKNLTNRGEGGDEILSHRWMRPKWKIQTNNIYHVALCTDLQSLLGCRNASPTYTVWENLPFQLGNQLLAGSKMPEMNIRWNKTEVCTREQLVFLIFFVWPPAYFFINFLFCDEYHFLKSKKRCDPDLTYVASLINVFGVSSCFSCGRRA